jgi:hypothetical protein
MVRLTAPLCLAGPVKYAWPDLPATEIDQAARTMLGWRLTANGVVVRLTEVEAYSGLGADPASHAHRGRTRATRSCSARPVSGTSTRSTAGK